MIALNKIESRIESLIEIRRSYIQRNEMRHAEQAWARIDELKKLKETLRRQSHSS